MPSHQRIRYNKWRKFDRIFADGKKQVRYIREVIYDKRRSRQYWEITTNPETLPQNETWYVMTRIPDVKYHQVGNFYGLRNWVEYGLKQSKNELGWADFRLTDYTYIEKWWEIVFDTPLAEAQRILAVVFAGDESARKDASLLLRTVIDRTLCVSYSHCSYNALKTQRARKTEPLPNIL